MAEVTVGVGPFVPDADAVVLKILDVSVTIEEPEEFVDDRFEMDFFCRHERKTVGKVEAHLVAEYGTCAGTGAVVFIHSVFENVVQKIEILTHCEDVISGGR